MPDGIGTPTKAELVDPLGRTVFLQETGFERQRELILLRFPGQLPIGNYLLRLTVEGGVFVGKVMIQR